MTWRIAFLLWLCIFVSAGVFPGSPQALHAADTQTDAPLRSKVFNATSFTLDNGLEVVVIPNHRVPVVTHMLWYKAGAADEPHGGSGAAHFLEHMMFKGSAVIGGEPLNPGEFSEKIRMLGGNDNAFTSQDFTAYFQSVPAAHLETVMRMEAGRMRGLQLSDAHFLSERAVVEEERRQRTDNNPQARLTEQMLAALYLNHPYGTPVIGWPQEISTLSTDDLKKFYDTWYAPNNAILIVTGDVKPEEVKRLATRIYGGIKPRENLPGRNRAAVPPLSSISRLIHRDAAVRERSIQKILRVPSLRQSYETALALQIIEDLMGNGSTSRLYKALVTEQKLATSAGLSYDGHRIDEANFYIYAVPAPGISEDAVLAAIEKELDTLANAGVTQEELQDAISRLQDQAVYARDSLSGPAMIIGQALSTGASLEQVEHWPDHIAAVTAEDIQSVTQTYLASGAQTGKPPVIGFLKPLEAEKNEKAGEAAP